MENISKTEALSLLSKWGRESKAISAFCFSPVFGFSSKNAHLTMCLDGSLEIALSEDTQLRISLSEAAFSRVRTADLPRESLTFLPQFDQGVRIDFAGRQIQWFIFTSVPRVLSEVTA